MIKLVVYRILNVMFVGWKYHHICVTLNDNNQIKLFFVDDKIVLDTACIFSVTNQLISNLKIDNYIDL